MKLIITRHGETVDNKKRVFQGHSPGKLTKEGKIQAKKLAKRLSKEKIDAIYSSDLKRAADTAKEIAKFHKKLIVQFDKRLRERNIGKHEGKPIPADWYKGVILEGMETNLEMVERLNNFIDEIWNKHKNETVLAVSHGGMKKAFYLGIYKDSLKDDTEIIFENTSISVFEVNGDRKINPVILNDTKHLDKPKNRKK